MSAAREKDQSDFDLEAFIDLFDEALTSDDPGVQKTLQHLMVICALARNHDGHSARSGPLRRLYDDQNNILRRLERLETDAATQRAFPGGYNPGSGPFGPTTIPTPYPTQPGTGTGTWPHSPGYNQIWCKTGSATSIAWPGDSAIAKSTTSYAYDPEDVPTLTDVVSPSPASNAIAERVDDLLKSGYKGSTVGKF